MDEVYVIPPTHCACGARWAEPWNHHVSCEHWTSFGWMPASDADWIEGAWDRSDVAGGL
jgi:hypothetical protein